MLIMETKAMTQIYLQGFVGSDQSVTPWTC